MKLPAFMRTGSVRGLLKLLALFLAGGMAYAQDTVPRFEHTACPFEGVEDRDDVQCGYLVVPENRSLSQGRQLRLSVAVLKSTSNTPEPDPLVYLSGGPGEPSLEYTLARLQSPFWARHRESRDLVFFDQRGTGFSEPEFCRETSFVLYTASFRGLKAADREALVVQSVEACREKMLAAGVDLGFYNSTASAQDLADLRRALGYEQWNLLGISYGTRLALTAMRDTPDGIRSAVIDSTWPPNAPAADDKARLMRSLNLAFEQCAADADCHAAYPALRQDFFAALRDFESNPMVLELGDPERFPDGSIVVDGNLLAWGVFQGFYDPNFVKIFPLFVRELGARNENVLAALVDGLAREPGTVFSIQSTVNCYEWTMRVTPELAEADQAKHPELALWQAYADQSAVCDALHDRRAPESEQQAVYSEIPTLVLAGEFDPVTPPSYGRLTADSLPNSTYIEFPATGHSALADSDCARDIMFAFLDEPSAPLDTVCVAESASIKPTTDAYMNAGIYRVTKQLLEPSVVFMAGVGLILLTLFSAVTVWPVAALLRRIRGRQVTGPAGATKARWLAAVTSILGIVFALALGNIILVTGEDNPYLLGFGVPVDAAPIFILPWLIMLGTIGMMYFAAAAWQQRWWTLSGRLHYLSIALACTGLAAGIVSLELI